MAILILNILGASAGFAILCYGIYSAVEEANPYWYSHFVVGSFLLYDRLDMFLNNDSNLNRLLSEPCSYCEGRGTLKSKRSICYDIYRDLERGAVSSLEGGDIFIKVNTEIDHILKEEEQQSIFDLERRLNRRIVIIAKEKFHMEQYEIST